MTIALFTFSITYFLIMIEKFPRFLISLLGALIVISSGILILEDAVHFVSWDTIGLLLGMFIIIRILEEGNFFNYLAVKIVERLNYYVYSIYFVFPLVTALLSGFMDSITVLIFFTILTINLAKIFKLNPIPLVIAEVCTANIGGSATLVVDPPNVIFGSLLGYTFNDFVKNNGPVALIATLIVALYFLLINRKNIKKSSHIDAEKITKSIDGETLLFFIGLFIVIVSLEKTGAISFLANKIVSISNGNLTILILLFIWGCGIISAIVDNVPMALTMAYILKSMLSSNPELAAFEDNLVFSLALGLDIGGNMTPIGASANVMAWSILGRNKINVGWLRWIKLSVTPTIIALLISSFGMLIKIK